MEKSKHSKTRILVVDDDRDIADMIVAYLSRLGCDVAVAYSGKDALSVFRPGAFQLVLSDLRMPDIDGLALLEALKKRDKRVPVIIISGYGTLDAAVQAIHKGAYDFITKPLKLDEMELLIQRAADQYELSAQLRRYKKYVLLLSASLPLWLLLGYAIVRFW